MNTITDGCCIIDAICGIDTASPQVGQFTDNFTKIKFIIKKNLQDYDILLLTDADGNVNFIAPDDDILIKSIDPKTNETSLLWNIGREITAESTVVIYQIVAYKGDIDNPQSTWYSKEGRLTVTESIDSSSKSASVIGTYPNLLTRLILAIEKCKENYNTLSDAKVDKEKGKNLSTNDFSDEMKEKLEGIESGANVNVNPDWNENDENMDSYIKNKPQILTEYDPESTQAMSGKAVAKALAALADSAPETLDTLKEIADALNNDPDFGATIISELSKKANSSDLSVVAKSGRYDDLSDIPDILSYYDPKKQNAVNSQAILSAIDSLGIKIKTISSIEELNSLTNHDDWGIYRLNGGSSYDDHLYLAVNFIRPIQYRFDNKICQRTFTTDKTWTSWKEIVVKSYNDLTDKPTIINESDVIEIIKANEYPVLRAESDDLGNKIRDTYARKDEIQNNLNIVHDIDVVEGDEEFDAVPSVRGLKIALVKNATDVVGYIDRSLENIIAKYGLGGDSV